MRHPYTLLFLAILVVQPASKAAAQTAMRVTDVGGTTLDLKKVILDYTDYRFGAVLISQMRELAGVRVSRGGGEVIPVGMWHNVAACGDGSERAWGNNMKSQLCEGTTG